MWWWAIAVIVDIALVVGLQSSWKGGLFLREEEGIGRMEGGSGRQVGRKNVAGEGGV